MPAHPVRHRPHHQGQRCRRHGSAADSACFLRGGCSRTPTYLYVWHHVDPYRVVDALPHLARDVGSPHCSCRSISEWFSGFCPDLTRDSANGSMKVRADTLLSLQCIHSLKQCAPRSTCMTGTRLFMRGMRKRVDMRYDTCRSCCSSLRTAARVASSGERRASEHNEA